MNTTKQKSFSEYMINGTTVRLKCQVCSGEVRFRIFEGVTSTTLIMYPHKCLDNSDIK